MQRLKTSSLLVLLNILTLSLIACSHSSKKPTDADSASINPDQSKISQNAADDFDSGGSDSGRIAGLQSVHFRYDKSSVEKADREMLRSDAAWIKSHPKIKIQIEGHCDDRGSVEYNLALGDRRAKAVVRYLIDLGVSADQLSSISYGKERPIVQGDSEEARAQNRRANLVPTR